MSPSIAPDIDPSTELIPSLPKPITRQLQTVRLPANRTVLEGHEPPSFFYIVRRGLLGNFRPVYPNKRILAGKLARGEPAGVTQLMMKTPYPAQLIPFKETLAYRGSRKNLENIGDKHPEFLTRLLLHENSKQNELFKKIEDFVGKELEQRIAEELLDLGRHLGRRVNGGDAMEIIIDLPRSRMARMVGAATESVIRIMSQWEKKGWIQTRDKRITLVKPTYLESIVRTASA